MREIDAAPAVLRRCMMRTGRDLGTAWLAMYQVAKTWKPGRGASPRTFMYRYAPMEAGRMMVGGTRTLLARCNIEGVQLRQESDEVALADIAVAPEREPDYLSDEVDALWRALDRMDQRLADIVVWHDIEHRTFRECGAQLGLTESRVCQIYPRAVGALRALVKYMIETPAEPILSDPAVSVNGAHHVETAPSTNAGLSANPKAVYLRERNAAFRIARELALESADDGERDRFYAIARGRWSLSDGILARVWGEAVDAVKLNERMTRQVRTELAEPSAAQLQKLTYSAPAPSGAVPARRTVTILLPSLVEVRAEFPVGSMTPADCEYLATWVRAAAPALCAPLPVS